jgi:thiamine biosynthesis lipoprotein
MKYKDFLKRLYPLILIALVFIVWKYREGKKDNDTMVELAGTTMGTIGYSVKYFDEDRRDFKSDIDTLLKKWNFALSTYIPDSEISRFNTGSDCFEFESGYLLPILEASRQVYERSFGAFDPTVGPLVNAWGFGPDKSMAPDSAKVDSLLQFVGFDQIRFDNRQVCKNTAAMKLDFSAIAKGNAVDVVGGFLLQKGIDNFLVEIGGEIVCKGTKGNNQPWITAIEDPTVAVYEREILATAELRNKAVATSGNYRNYYVHKGKKYAHTINPATGFPVFNTILSASVFANDCMTADAYATAFMVMGMAKSKEILEKDDALDAFLIYRGEDGEVNTFVTRNIAPFIKQSDAQD